MTTQKLENTNNVPTAGKGQGDVLNFRKQAGMKQVTKSLSRRNQRERNRVKLLNLAFASLREHVPDGESNKKLSKADTLKSAILYIRELEMVLDDVRHYDAVMQAMNSSIQPSYVQTSTMSPSSQCTASPLAQSTASPSAYSAESQDFGFASTLSYCAFHVTNPVASSSVYISPHGYKDSYEHGEEKLPASSHLPSLDSRLSTGSPSPTALSDFGSIETPASPEDQDEMMRFTTWMWPQKLVCC